MLQMCQYIYVIASQSGNKSTSIEICNMCKMSETVLSSPQNGWRQSTTHSNSDIINSNTYYIYSTYVSTVIYSFIHRHIELQWFQFQQKPVRGIGGYVCGGWVATLEGKGWLSW
jgi:hypothetical protein